MLERYSLSRICYLASITTITLGLSFEGIFMMLLLEQYLHEKSLESSRCVTINLSLVMQREKCVVCEKSRSPAFPCYEHHVFYVLDSTPHRKQNAHSPTSTSGFNLSSSSTSPSLVAERRVHTAPASARTQRASSTTPAPIYHADPALQDHTSSKMAMSILRRRFANLLHVLPEQVHGPVFLYESHYTWTRLVDMRERERDHHNYHPVRYSNTRYDAIKYEIHALQNCAKVECNAEYELNREAIDRYVRNYMPKPHSIEPFVCFAGESADEGGEHAAFIKRTLSGVLLFHLLLWPAVCSLVGLLALLLNLAFMGCEVWHD